MKLSTRSIISAAILLASSLKTNSHPVELKGVDKVVHVGQVSNHVREEFIEITGKPAVKDIDIEPYGPLFDLVCQSDLTNWCTQYPEQCAYVKTLCVKNDSESYCAFDIYKKYVDATNNNANGLNSYMDLCDECLIEMATEFKAMSTDKKAIDEMNNLSEMCKIKLVMDNMVQDENANDKNVISNLAALAPADAKLKRHYGKIHSFKNPDTNGFVKANGKIKYGNVGINEKVNTSIHSKNLRSAQMNKRQEEDFKEKIALALENIKYLALQQVSSSFTNLEINVSVLLQDNLFISDPEGIREKNVLTEEILSNIKDILNSEVIEEQESETETAAPIFEKIEFPVDIPTDIENIFEKEPIEAMFNNKKFEVDGVFEINDNDEYDVYIASPTDEVETSVPENKEEVVNEEPTDLIPINDDAEDGDDEEEISQEEVENTDTDDEEEVPPPPPGPHHGTPPDVKPEVPKITPGKPTKPNQHEHPGLPNKPWKFGYPSKPKNPIYPGKQGILHSINKLFEENKDHHSNPAHEPANLYMPIKKWIMKKSNYVVSKELLAEDLEEAQEIIEEVSVPNSFIDDDIPAETIKLNNPDNHRDNNDEEEVFEIGSKKVSYINSSHPVKPTLNFRKSDEERRDTH